MNNFDYIQYDDKSQSESLNFKIKFESIMSDIDTVLNSVREKELARQKLEESFMWVGKAIRNDQIIRTGEPVSGNDVAS